MKTFLLLMVGVLTLMSGYAQKIKTIDRADICEAPTKTYNNILPVTEFKDRLEVAISINEITLGSKTEQVDLFFIETITNESSVFKINGDMAISVSIGRVEENGSKFYLYKVHLFRKVKGCWEDSAWGTNWTKCNLGTVTHGYGYGNQGTSGFIQFAGGINVE